MTIAGVDVTGILISSAVVGAVVAGLISFFTQRHLLERKARVDYQYEARKRLNEVIGPLRMQLLFAARDVVRRVRGHAGHTGWDMDPTGSFVRTFVYRLLRPLAISQLIEGQMSTADFSVDPAAIALLRFSTNAERMLSGNEIVLEHPDVDWVTQSQHLFRDNLRAAAAKLIAEDDGDPVVINYARFQREIPELLAVPELKDLTHIFVSSGDTLSNTPLFMLRIVGYAYACSQLIAEQGIAVGFEDVPLPVTEILESVADERISGRVPDYLKVFDEIYAQGL